MAGFRSQRGVTLIELVVTLAIFAIGAALAYPSFTGIIRTNRVAATTNNMIAAANLARSEAVRSNRGAGLCPSTSGTLCNGVDWNEGVLVYTDLDGSGTWSAGDVAVRHFAANDAVQVTALVGAGEAGAGGVSNAPQLAYDNRGRPDRATDFRLVPDNCPDGQAHVRRLVVARTGQTRMNEESCQ